MLIFMTVLIADDEELPRKILETRIPWQELGFTRVLTASHGREAFALTQTEMPDLIISDIKMPKMDGLTLAHTVKEHFSDIRFILLTNYGDKNNLKQAIKFKIDSFIDKPIRIDEITKEIRELVPAIKKKARIHAANVCETENTNAQNSENPFAALEQTDDSYAADKDLIARLLAGLPKQNNEPDVSAANPAVALVTGYIQEHFTDPMLSLSVIAEKTGYALTYLCRLFKKYSHLTINECIMNMRILKAKELLFQTDNGIYRIGNESGYTNGKYFVKLFKRKTGMHPEEYRTRVKNAAAL